MTNRRLRRAVSAGLVDAGFASAATFVVAAYAAAVLEADELGTYAIYMTAFLAAVAFPRQFVFIPSEVVAVEEPEAGRMALVRQTIRIGMGPSVAAAIVAIAAAALVTGQDVRGEALPFAATMGAALVVSPIQDHIRRMFHLAGRSWNAALISTVQIVTLVTAMTTFGLTGVPTAWIPFGSLFVANAISLAVALLVALTIGSSSTRIVHFRHLVALGSRLAVVGLLPAIAAFVAASLLLAIEGRDIVGLAEASRVVSRPILVLGTGIFAPLRPRSLEAAAARDEAEARRVTRLFTLIMVGASVLLLAAFGVAWPGNLFARLIPKAYVIGGLVAVAIVAQTAEGLTRPLRSELTAGRREATLVKVEALGNLLRVGIAGLAGLFGAFVLPAGVLALAAVRFIVYRRALGLMYRQPRVELS